MLTFSRQSFGNQEKRFHLTSFANGKKQHLLILRWPVKNFLRVESLEFTGPLGQNTEKTARHYQKFSKNGSQLYLSTSRQAFPRDLFGLKNKLPPSFLPPSLSFFFKSSLTNSILPNKRQNFHSMVFPFTLKQQIDHAH